MALRMQWRHCRTKLKSGAESHKNTMVHHCNVVGATRHRFTNLSPKRWVAARSEQPLKGYFNPQDRTEHARAGHSLTWFNWRVKLHDIWLYIISYVYPSTMQGHAGPCSLHECIQRRSNSASKLTIQKLNFLILRQLTHRCILMLCPWHCRSTSCHRKLSIGRHDRLCSRSAVITCKLNKLCHNVPFEWKVIFEDTVYTNRSGTPSWTMLLLMCSKYSY